MHKVIKYIKKINIEPPTICMILGSGLNSFVEEINNKTIINYKDIPGFFNTSVKGHKGQLIFGNINNTPILCASGRFHYYEGYSFNQTSILIDLFKIYNPKLCIITNSSGCLNLNWSLGSFMIAKQILDFSFIDSGLPKYYKLNSKKYFDLALKTSKKINIKLHKGTYTFTMGPSYETKAEINEIIKLKGNAVGMSTFPEFLKCKKLGLDLIIISCLTNYGAGLLNNNKVKHKDVIDNASKAKTSFKKLIINIIQNIEHQKIQKI